jgi:4-amino-4-deoxy-L-arabinose transferase-like glycosyltransferase
VVKKRRQIQRGIIVCLSLFAYFWRLQGLSCQSLWRDEIDAIYFAVRDLPETLAMFVNEAQNGALFFLSLRPWLRLTGSSEFALRYPAVLFGMLSVALLWQVGRRLMPGRIVRPSKRRLMTLLHLIMGSAPVLAAAFLAANPYQLFYGQDGKMYALVTFLSLLATWFWLQSIDRGGWRPWLGYLAVVSIAIHTHLLMVLLLPLGITWFFIAWPQSREHKMGLFLSIAGLVLPYLPLLGWQWQFLTSNLVHTFLDFYPLHEVVESVLVGQIIGAREPVELLTLAPILFLGLAGLLLGFLEIFPRPEGSLARLSATRRHLIIVAWAIVPTLGIFLLSIRQPVFLPRYIIWIAPALMMLLALGVQLLWHNESRLARPLAAILVVYLLLFWISSGQQQKAADLKPDLRAAVAAVANNRQPEELLILQAPHLEIVYRYYSGDMGSDPLQGSDRRLGRWAPGPWTNNELDDAEARRQVAQAMEAMTEGAGDVWVILNETEAWDERELMTGWLDAHAALVDKAGYHEVQVLRYRFQ